MCVALKKTVNFFLLGVYIFWLNSMNNLHAFVFCETDVSFFYSPLILFAQYVVIKGDFSQIAHASDQYVKQ